MSKHQMLYIALAVIAVAVVVWAVVAAVKKRRSERLRSTFGPEYDRTVETTGDRGRAEAELAGRAKRRSSLTIVPLSAESQRRHQQEWREVQAGFVDQPREAVRAADGLVTRVMTERGYPMSDFEQQAADVSVDHPDVVENYRSAHRISLANDESRATTEELRRAMTHYRSLFERLLGTEDGADPERTAPARGELRS